MILLTWQRRYRRRHKADTQVRGSVLVVIYLPAVLIVCSSGK